MKEIAINGKDFQKKSIPDLEELLENEINKLFSDKIVKNDLNKKNCK